MPQNTAKTDMNKEIFEMGSEYLMPTYARLPAVFTKAKMQYLWDANGKGYLYFISKIVYIDAINVFCNIYYL